MKQKILILLAVIAVTLGACTSNFEELNTNTKSASDVPGDYIFTNGEYLLSYYLTSNNVNIGIFNMMAQYITETTYTDEANYDLVNRSISQNFNRRIFIVLSNFNSAEQLIQKELAVGDEPIAVKNNRLFIISILKAYTYQYVVDLFGDIPYTEALSPIITTPVYDDAATIYGALIDSVQAAVAGLDDTYGSFGDQDLIYSGDVAAWKKFGHALLIKLAINLYDVDATTAKSVIESSYDKTFTSTSDGAFFPFTAGSPYYNPIYEDLVASGRKDFVVCATLLDNMDTINDSRLSAFINPADTLGGTYGASNNYATYSHVADPILEPDFHGFLLNYDEVLFYLAEAAAKGASVGSTADVLYADAVTESVNMWVGDVSGVPAYLTAHPYVDVKTIAKEAWISMYMRGFIGWTFYRRIDGAVPLVMPPSPPEGLTVVPTRFTYPINEQTLNAANYQAAATAIGGDKLDTKLFWDIH